MRIPEKDEDLTGKICVCNVGRPAIVVEKGSILVAGTAGRDGTVEEPKRVDGWRGLGLDGKGTWFSTEPAIIAESGKEFHDKLNSRFGGKMSYNG